jgi:hypothetical protein
VLERDHALELLNNAIEQVVPHINGDIEVKTVIEDGPKRPQVTITVEEWQARMKDWQVLVSLLDRKAKLLGMDAPVKVEPPPVVVPGTQLGYRARWRRSNGKLAKSPAELCLTYRSNFVTLHAWKGSFSDTDFRSTASSSDLAVACQQLLQGIFTSRGPSRDTQRP